MKIFISSVIRGMEPLRDAAAEGIAALGYRPVRAEDFGASPDSPQRACLAEARDADLMVLILGERYGQPQVSGMSATHEEYREVRDSTPVLVFIQDDIDPEPSQLAFIDAVRGWESGHYTEQFRATDDLQHKVLRGIHNHALTNQAMPLDADELAARARELVSSSAQWLAGAELRTAIACGPNRAVLRPAELEQPELEAFLRSEALTGSSAVLSTMLGTQASIQGNALRLEQGQGGGSVVLTETAGLMITQPATDSEHTGFGLTALVEEDVAERITLALRFAATVLDRIDSVGRLTHVAPVVALTGAGYAPWRRRAEDAGPFEAFSVGSRSADPVIVSLDPAVRRRAALNNDVQQLAADFTVRLRREMT